MAKTAGAAKVETAKVKAAKVGITQLVADNLYEKSFATGSRGFFGKVIDPQTGLKYQVTGIEIGSKPKDSKSPRTASVDGS